MGRKKGSANFAGSLEVLAGAPLDARTVVDTKADLTAANTFSYFHEGITVYVKADKKKYTLIGDDPTVAANWREEGSGSQGSGEPAGTSYSGTLTVAGWDSSTKQQTVTFTGYDASYNGVIGVPADATAAQKEAYCNNGITVVSQSGATVTFKAETIPDVAIPIAIYCGGGSGSSGGGTADFPAGGTTGQALVKASDADDDVKWETIESGSDIKPSTTAPSMDGTAAIGSSDKYARADHVHPSDTSKQNKLTASNGINIMNNTISTDNMPSADLSEIVNPLPGVMSRRHKYSTDEQVVGEWIDGKPVYQKTVDCSGLPASGQSKEYPTNINNLGMVIDYSGVLYKPSNGASKMLPYCDGVNDAFITVEVGASGNLRLLYTSGGTDFSAFSVGYITIQYTKTTD